MIYELIASNPGSYKDMTICFSGKQMYTLELFLKPYSQTTIAAPGRASLQFRTETDGLLLRNALFHGRNRCESAEFALISFVGKEIFDYAVLKTEGIGCTKLMHDPGKGSRLMSWTCPQGRTAVIVAEPSLVHYSIDSYLLRHLLLVKNQGK